MLLLCWSSTITTDAEAQENASVYNNNLHFGPVQLLFNEFYVRYERLYGNYGSALTAKLAYKESDRYSKQGILVQFNQKFYLKNMNCEIGNFYISPGIRYSYTEIKDYGYVDKFTSAGFFFLGGGLFEICSRLSLDLSVGGIIIKTESDLHEGNMGNTMDENFMEPGFSGVAPSFNFTFGFVF